MFAGGHTPGSPASGEKGGEREREGGRGEGTRGEGRGREAEREVKGGKEGMGEGGEGRGRGEGGREIPPRRSAPHSKTRDPPLIHNFMQ